MAAFNTRSHAG